MKFSVEDKMDLLESLALTALTVRTNSDSEEFTRESIIGQLKVSLPGGTDVSALLSELIDAHGILRLTDTRRYTFTHRTFQEYFAARGALRTMETAQALSTFTPRDDLSETLAFYASIEPNTLHVQAILEHLVTHDRWYLAARCLQYIQTVPDAEVVGRIVEYVADSASTNADTILSFLDILSSLSTRRERPLAHAAQRFQEVVEVMLSHGPDSQAAQLYTLLAANPEGASSVLPALLKHPKPAYREAGLNLLRDLESDDSLDQLVLLLSSDFPERLRVGVLLAQSIKRHNKQLRARTLLFPASEIDLQRWPLDALLPSRVALGILNAVAETETGNAAIDTAINSYQCGKKKDRQSRKFARSWQKLPVLLRRDAIRRRLGHYVACVSEVLIAITASSISALVIACSITGRVVAISPEPPRVSVFDFRHAHSMAAIVEKALEQKQSLRDRKHPFQYQPDYFRNIQGVLDRLSHGNPAPELIDWNLVKRYSDPMWVKDMAGIFPQAYVEEDGIEPAFAAHIKELANEALSRNL
jgi:hypothetical protein